MGSIAAAISLDEYLSTTYEPDMEFVDGLLVKRNVGTQRHSLLQSLIIICFGSRRVSNIDRGPVDSLQRFSQSSAKTSSDPRSSVSTG